MTIRKKIALVALALVGLSGAAYAYTLTGPGGYYTYRSGSSAHAVYDIQASYVWSDSITEGDSLLVEGPPTLTGGGTVWSVHVASGNTFLEGALEVVPNNPTSGVPSFNVNTGAGTYWFGDGGAGAGLNTTADTTGFIYVPTVSGTPTGTPAGLGARSGATATVYDQTGDHLWIYNASSHTWKAH